jgi:hypothetical protein
MRIHTMPLTNSLPFGLRDVRLFPLNASGVRGTGVDLPVSRTFSFKETVSAEQLVGDDVIVGSHDYNPMVEWELEAGGYSLDAFVVLSGGILTSSGTTPAQIKTLSKKTTDGRPYFEVEGQAISDSGGDFHVVVYRCKCDGDLDGKFENGAFALTKATGKGYGRTDNQKLWDLIQNETAIAPTG